MSDYKISIKRTLKHEDPTLSGKVTSDTGGLTRWGISQKAFPKLNIKNLTLLEAMEIYKTEYFNPLKLDQVNDQKVADVIFDFGVNTGVSRAVTVLQLVLDVKVEDLKKFGMLPEFLGRMPIICPLQELDKKQLLQILTEPKNALCKQYQELFNMDNIELESEKEALLEIAEKAIKRKTGARALRGILEDSLLPHMFSIPDDESITKVIITKECICESKDPIIERKEIS